MEYERTIYHLTCNGNSIRLSEKCVRTTDLELVVRLLGVWLGVPKANSSRVARLKQ